MIKINETYLDSTMLPDKTIQVWKLPPHIFEWFG